ncbi:hypothetical protein MOMMJLID_CDS0006 [Arthrobacter phage 1191A]|nr:hypothetical protein MOMMJLID_CDS0006 [Arthrobacter phage 1191A]
MLDRRSARQGNVHERGRDTHSQSHALLNAGTNTVVIEILSVRVSGLHTHATLAVHSRSSIERAHNSSTSRNSSRNNSALAPKARLFLNATTAVLSGEEATAEVLTISVSGQTQTLVINRVDHNAISRQAGSGLNLSQSTEQRISIVVNVLRSLNLHTRSSQQTLNGRAGTWAGEQLCFLSQREQVKSALVDFRNPEVSVFHHLIGERQDSGDLFQSVSLSGWVANVELWLKTVLSHGSKSTFNSTLHQISHRITGKRTSAEQIRHHRATESTNNGAIKLG